MALPTPPFPPSGRFVEYVRGSSRALTQAEAVTISNANIERLLLSPAFTETYHRITATSHGLAFPLNFPSSLSELNLLSILALLNMASGYRVPLHRETGRGAWDSIRAFVLGLYLSSATDGEGDLLSAMGMQTLSEAKIAELLGVSLHTERQHERIHGLTIGQVGGPGWELVQLLKTLLDETGKVLVNGGYPNLGSFVAEALKEGARVAHDKGDPAVAADVVLEQLVRAVPGFQDMSIVNNQPIYCFKKALFLINAIAIRFAAKRERNDDASLSESSAPPFPIPHASHLPVFADNVLPSILIHLGVIDLSTTSCTLTLANIFPAIDGAAAAATAADPALLLLAAAPEPRAQARTGEEVVVPVVDGPVLTPAQTYVLRAAAIEACERIVSHAHAMGAAGRGAPWLKDLALPDLDNWLWAVAKDRPDYRALPRFVLRNTPFF
ncbi:hypothetical protein DFH94DRAFT_627090 [Russula ochroleuca]|uniref:Queuosine 5'-phosphate N-glycosylase/hydrolase n=1 Tax=Russula ochroleuca TaxID=152965 RepID=A0A9P5N083_9AGAM|nr:hypothetical protein DFH94DRAFT_627090 [Russula ochroleuca]